MFTLKATILALPLLASAGTSTIAATRAQRRSELLELLQHNHEKRWEQYDEQPVCEVHPGNNQASFTAIDNLNVGKPLAAAVTSYAYSDADSIQCASQAKCMNACIVDAAQCIGISFTAQVCTLYGSGYSGPSIEVVPTDFQQMTDAGTTSASSGGVSAMTVATCAIKGLNNDNLLSPAANNNKVGQCQCGPGRTQATLFTCKAAGVSPDYFSADNPPQILTGPITTTTPITWSAAFQAVPAVMTNLQCASICAQDAACQAYLLTPGTELSSCYKIGLSGAYSSPPGFPFTPSSSTRVKRQAQGQTGSFGNAGDIFGQPGSSQIVTNLPAHPGASQKAGLRKRSMRHMGQSQW